MTIYLIILAALAPAIWLLWTIYRKDSAKPEPTKWLVKAFVYGIGSVFLSFVISGPIIMEQKEMNITKTKVFNVIILDRSGSMECIRQAAVEGFNETLAGIKKAQEKFAETQDHFVSLVTFCSCETKHVFDKTPVADEAFDEEEGK